MYGRSLLHRFSVLLVSGQLLGNRRVAVYRNEAPPTWTGNSPVLIPKTDLKEVRRRYTLLSSVEIQDVALYVAIERRDPRGGAIGCYLASDQDSWP